MTDPGIILFGKKIGLPETTKTTAEGRHEHTLITPYDQQKDGSDGDPETPSIDEEGMSENPQAIDGETMNSQPRTLKKPDKILPCPRCDSMNTKFCYFNNSNVNQPRHFCKSCQRYWTAGGTMRNMPVGAGRRKKKTPPSSYRYIISQEGLESNSSEGIPPKVLSFGEDCSSSSTVEKIQDNNGFHSHFHWIPGASWPYNPWNASIPIPMPIPPVYPPGYPQIPMYPPPYWNPVSWLPPTNSILGKHPTDEEKSNGSHEESKKQRNSILIPKTLRIHDPDEAAKSSIWATLGIKNEHSGRGDLFQAFQSKGNEKRTNKANEPSPVLQANPAAFSRSLCFQERA
ncbi:hypothetical protein L1987_51727 [Smallanthus sonchifolius]|uniref:Uncharacterized protein n=1 Tax=Smallanthus sonchifolius TaxID=185202 RepID=A0ACB9ERQ8_9ASTR|nr:hypothetical protein L1987_51727 [Smallanthus sonchifolius]